jgi:hypothetical protein
MSDLEQYFEHYLEKNLEKHLNRYFEKKSVLQRDVYTIKEAAYIAGQDINQFREETKNRENGCPIVHYGNCGRFKIPKHAFHEWLKTRGKKIYVDPRRPGKKVA